MIETIKPYRSVLYMPGANTRALDKARSLKADAIIYGFSIDFTNGNTDDTDADQYAVIELYNDAFDAILTSTEFFLTREMIDAGTVTIKLDDAYEVFAGELYYAALTAYGDGNLIIAHDYDGDDDNSTLIIRDQVYGASNDPYVNLNFIAEQLP